MFQLPLTALQPHSERERDPGCGALPLIVRLWVSMLVTPLRFAALVSYAVADTWLGSQLPSNVAVTVVAASTVTVHVDSGTAATGTIR